MKEVKEVLSQIVKLQAEMLITAQGMGDHLNALETTLFAHHRNDGLEADVRKQLAQQQRASHVNALKFESALQRIEQAITEIPKK